MKIIFFECSPLEQQYIKSNLKGHTLKFVDEPLDENNVKTAKSYDVLSVFIYSKLTAQMLSELPKLKLVSSRSTGYDHIDVKVCRKRKIPVTNVPTYGENTVAEHAFALLMSISRNIHKSHIRTFKHDYSNEGLIGCDLKGKTIGIIGGGHIGMHVANIARGFSMNILVYDINQNNFLSELIGFQYVDLERLLKTSDVITIHTPYNKHTHHMINMDNIKKIKKGAVFINTSRGGIIDTEALLYALDKGIISNAGLDVIEDENILFGKADETKGHNLSDGNVLKILERNQKVIDRDNVVFTPHNAFNSKEALYRILDKTIDNIQKGKDSECVIN
ncbi:MAG: NAD(P)-dependent oxidoreductase [Candidatus Woesearchaeota archaeon]